MSTSRLQRQVSNLLSTYLGGNTIRENTRPDWLTASTGERLELDFYLPELKVAIEVNGRQHYTYSSHFHKSYEDFKKQLHYDSEKERHCANEGIRLYIVTNYDEAIELISVLADIKLTPAIHPNALLQQERIKQAQLDAKPQRKKKVILSERYTQRCPNIIRKHLTRLALILSRVDKEEDLTPKMIERLDIGLRALRQYQEIKGDIDYDTKAKSLIALAAKLVKEYFPHQRPENEVLLYYDEEQDDIQRL